MIFDKIKLKDIAEVIRNNFLLLQTLNAKMDRILNYLHFLESRLKEYGIEVDKRSLH